VLPLVVEGERRDIRVAWDAAGGSVATEAVTGGDVDILLAEAGAAIIAIRDGRQALVAEYDPFSVDVDEVGGHGGVVKAPMHGKLVALFVAPGETVHKGQRLAVVEAMKMEHVLTAAHDGVVAEVLAAPGQQVAEGARLILLREMD
jgi:3-methylcrotonyl-CoA carboxylase alpha subunit